MAQLIPLTGKYGSEKFAIVDDELLDDLNRYSWYLTSAGYAARSIYLPETQGKRVLLMHRYIMGDPPGWEVDHRNRVRLDNRRENLRTSTHQQNMVNSAKKLGVSGFRGVWHSKDKKGWAALIGSGSGNERIYLGTFPTAEIAALIYNEAAMKLYGEFAVLNDVPTTLAEIGYRSPLPGNFPDGFAGARKPIGSQGQFVGVCWQKDKSRWVARIKHQRTPIFLGYYEDPTEAGYIYDQAAIQIYGRKARLNFPEGYD